MKLYFLRHAHADWPKWPKRDDERPLTAKGRRQAHRVARLLRKLRAAPELIVTSPLPRAKQTAEIAAEHLCIKVKDEPSLVKSFDREKLRALIARTGGADLMLVGHEPDFSATLRQLTGARVKLAKAGLARVDLETPDGDGLLIWLLPPKRALRG